MRSHYHVLLIFSLIIIQPLSGSTQVNWEWNEELLESIRNDIARPVVHSRNLYQHSLGMYNIYDNIMLSNENQLAPAFDDGGSSPDLDRTWSGFSYGFIMSRYGSSPGLATITANLNSLIQDLHGSDASVMMSDDSFLLGYNYGLEIDSYFMFDGANQANGFENTCYTPVNDPLDAETPGDCVVLTDPGHWQPLSFGVTGSGGGQDFLGANWGDVTPFALDPAAGIEVTRDGCTYTLYEDPGSPQYLEDGGDDPYSYIEGFAIVVNWQQHLNSGSEDEGYIDISPRNQGNIGSYPDAPEIFYDIDGANLGPGHAFNPITLEPYAENMVLRSDFTRVLPEFWADGPSSETPPGHWFSIMNHDVFGTPEFTSSWKGEDLISEEEWLARAYLLMGGAFHDCSISAWGIKAYYDFIRPISAIRHMQSLGQSSDATLDNYHEYGLPLIEGSIEVIEAGDPLLIDYPSAAEGDIKIKQWIPAEIEGDPSVYDWRPGCHWLPYQLPSFVTPPFAGYVSGHSTYSSAAAKLLSEMTGSEFFPGGMGSFTFDDDYLAFDVGPSEGFSLEWATYKDAADQSGLSRIWGGIHPPIDDIRGRNIGESIGQQCLDLGAGLFEGAVEINEGCTYSNAENFDFLANSDDGSCLFDEGCPEDINEDGLINVQDLLELLGQYGLTCD